jgi:hypothetical protein
MSFFEELVEDIIISFFEELGLAIFGADNILFRARIEPEEFSIAPKVKCPFCGKWVPVDLFAVHLATEHGNDEEEGDE